MLIRDSTTCGVKLREIKLENLGDEVSIEVKVNKNSGGFLFFFLVDPEGHLRVQHMVGKGVSKVLLGQKSGSIGTYPGPLPGGNWKIYTIGLSDKEEYSKIEYEVLINSNTKIDPEDYTLLGESIWVEYASEKKLFTLTFDSDKKISQEKRWYRGDLHAHTTLTDGHMKPKEVKDFCEKAGLDFIFLTEHNLIHTGFEDSRVLFIPALEVTTVKGHLIVYGLKKLPNFLVFNDFHNDFVRFVLEKKQSEKYIINIAHPTMKPWEWQFNDTALSKIDLIEICNCPAWPPAEEDNSNAIKLLDLLWNDGYRIYGVGGSDNHLKPDEKYPGAKKPSLYGDPSTWVYCNGLSEAEILKSLKNGSCYVSRDVELDIAISDGIINYLPGSEVKGSRIYYEVKIKNKHRPFTVNLIRNGKLVETKFLYNESRASFIIEWEDKDFEWVRTEVRTIEGEFVAYVNPVFRGFKKHSYIKWGDLMESYAESKNP